MSRRVLFWVTLVVTLVLDQAVKLWARTSMNERGSLDGLPWPGVFEFTLTYNKGIAFGLFQGAAVFMTPIAVAIAIGAAVYSWRNPQERTIAHVAMALLASGALGNLYDRLAFGKVTDMFYARIINFPVFNIADACITIATFLLIIAWWRDAKPNNPEPAPALNPPADPERSPEP